MYRLINKKIYNKRKKSWVQERKIFCFFKTCTVLFFFFFSLPFIISHFLSRAFFSHPFFDFHFSFHLLSIRKFTWTCVEADVSRKKNLLGWNIRQLDFFCLFFISTTTIYRRRYSRCTQELRFLAQLSRPEYGLSGIRGGIVGTGRLQNRQIYKFSYSQWGKCFLLLN